MFERMVRAEDPSIAFDVISISNAAALPHPDKPEATLITGSAPGVYDELDWIAPLERLVRGLGQQDSNGRRLLWPSVGRAGPGRPWCASRKGAGASAGTSIR
jgi:hypothetical protein